MTTEPGRLPIAFTQIGGIWYEVCRGAADTPQSDVLHEAVRIITAEPFTGIDDPALARIEEAIGHVLVTRWPTPEQEGATPYPPAK